MATTVVFQESPKGPRAEVIQAMVDERVASQTAASGAATSAAASLLSSQGAAASAQASAGSAAAALASENAAAESETVASGKAAEAQSARDASVAARDEAVLAKDAANASGRVYPTTAAGIAASTVGQYFTVPSASVEGYLSLYRVDAGPVATFLKEYPSTQKVDAIEGDLGAEVETRTLLITQTPGGGFAVTDESGFVLIKVDSSGAVRTMLHDLGVDLSGGFALKDASGFVSLRVSASGDVSFGGLGSLVPLAGTGFAIADETGFVMARFAAGLLSLMGAANLTGVSGDGLAIADDSGFVMARFAAGVLSLMGQAHLSGAPGEGMAIVDPCGFVGMRFDEAGLFVMGESAATGSDFTESAISAAPEVDLSRTGVLRRSPLDLQKWRMARGDVIQGTGEARILCIGDSNTAVSGHETGTLRRANSYPSALARILDRHIGATWAGFYGSAGQGAAYPVFDPRVTMGAGWSPLGAAVTLGGEVFANTTTTSALSFAPGVEWDVAEVTVIGLGAGALTMDIGGATTPFSATSGAATVLTFSAGSVGQHTLNINRVSGGTHVASWVFRNSANPAVTVINGARGGWQSSDIIDATAYYSPGSILPTVTCDLVLIEIGINDHTAGVAPATFAANLQAIIDLCPAGADVVILSSVTPTDAGKAYLWSDYRAAMRAVADANALPFIDMTIALGDRALIEANGWHADNVHPKFSGLAEKAKTVSKLLLA